MHLSTTTPVLCGVHDSKVIQQELKDFIFNEQGGKKEVGDMKEATFD